MIDNGVELVDDDITILHAGAIVNAANNSLLGGGGVDGAIHRAAGPQLLASCRTMQGCATGQAKITEGYRLPARYVIHTVGPIWQGGNNHEAELLASCYKQCFKLAAEHKIKTIAFPAISTGVYGFPKQEAAIIAIRAARAALADNPKLQKITMVCFNQETKQAYQAALSQNCG